MAEKEAENVKKKKEGSGEQGAAKVAVGAADLRIAAGECDEGTWRRRIHACIKGVSFCYQAGFEPQDLLIFFCAKTKSWVSICC